MSTSTRSKPASESSPAGGPETDADAADATEAPVEPAEIVEVELETSRQRVISWTFFGIVFGALLVWKLGTVGVWVGYALMVVGAYRGYQLAMSLIHPAGKIVVSGKEVVLPRSIHRPKPFVVPPKD